MKNTYFIFNNFCFQKSYGLLDDIEKYGTSGQATDDDMTLHKPFAYFIPKATDTYSDHVIFIAFPKEQ
jgi:hypothetical protein